MHSVVDGLYEVGSWRDAWQGVLEPWLEAVSTDWIIGQRKAVIVPTVVHIQALKEAWLRDHPEGCLGLEWYTPSDVRSVLLESLGEQPSIIGREALQLLAVLVTEKYPENNYSTLIAQSPQLLAEAYDAKTQSGAVSMGDDELDVLMRAFEEALCAAGCTTVPCVSLEMRERCKPESSVWDAVLIYGFSANDWRHRWVLESACMLSRQRTVCHLMMEGKAHELWMSTWEEMMGASMLLNESVSMCAPILRVVEQVPAEVDVIVTQIMEYVADDRCERLGVVFGDGRSIMAREVALRLEQKYVHYVDAIGYMNTGSSESSVMIQWIRWQLDQTIDAYFEWFRLVVGSVDLEWKRILLKAHCELMTESMPVIKNWIREMNPELYSKWEWTLKLLNAQGTIEYYVSESALALKLRVREDWWDPLMQWIPSVWLDQTLTHRKYLTWLSLVVRSTRKMKLQSTAFAKVHLVTPRLSAGMNWTHIIIAGVHESSWKMSEVSGLIQQEVIQKWNECALVDGSQGEGHQIVSWMRSYFLDAYNEHIIVDGMLEWILRSEACVTITLALRGMTIESKSNDRVIGRLLSQDLEAAKRATCAWMSLVCFETKAPLLDAFRRVHVSRRDPNQPFDAYLFGFESGSSERLKLSCKAWEEAFLRPGSAWIRYIAKLEPWMQAGKGRLLQSMVGTWMHDWIELWPRGSALHALPSTESWHARIHERSADIYARVQRSYAQCSQGMPPYWVAQWQDALSMSLAMSSELQCHEPWSYGVSEWSLHNDSVVCLPSGCTLTLSGRVDGILSTAAFTIGQDTRAPMWIIDFKTGSKQVLTKGAVAKGNGLQLVLYGLSLQALGYGNVALSIIKPNQPISQQLSLEEVLELDELWQRLEWMHTHSTLGMGDIRSDYHFVGDYPLATLPIDSAILEHKVLFMQSS